MNNKPSKHKAAVDLNIDNYTLDDLLHLFQLRVDFTEDDLKRAKRTVLATHPDKSQLPPEHFRFFVQAYNIIKGIFDFRHKSMHNDLSHVPKYDMLKDEHTMSDLQHNAQKLLENKKFNEQFNKLFEKHKLANEFTDSGYHDWLKSNEDLDDGAVVTNEAGLHAAIETKKRNLKAIIAVQDLQGLASGSLGTDLLQTAPASYGSDLGSGLQFEDLKQAYTQTVIPVTHEDYLQRPKYRTVEEFVRDPRYANVQVISERAAHDQLAQQQAAITQSSMQRAFELQRLEERAKEANAKFAAAFRHLTV